MYFTVFYQIVKCNLTNIYVSSIANIAGNQKFFASKVALEI